MPQSGNGEIDKDELRRLLKTGMDESSVQLSETKLDHLTDTLFASADQDNSGSISFDEFLETLRRQPDLMNNFSVGLVNHFGVTDWRIQKDVYTCFEARGVPVEDIWFFSGSRSYKKTHVGI